MPSIRLALVKRAAFWSLAASLALSACSGPYRQVSRGKDFNRRLAACSFPQQIRATPPASSCAEALLEFDRLEPFRSYVKVAPPGPVVNEVDVEYFCIVPHHVLVEVSGGHVSGMEVNDPLVEAGSLVPQDIENAVRRSLFGLPEAADVRMSLRAAYRRVTAYEIIKHGTRSFTATASWKASADLSAMIDPLSEVGSWDDRTPSDLGCGGRWLEFESPPALATQSLLLNVGDRGQSQLRRAFETAVLENARTQLGGDNAKENEEAFERLTARSKRPSKVEQTLSVVITAWPGNRWVGSAHPAVAKFEVPTRETLMNGLERVQRLAVFSESFELTLRIGPMLRARAISDLNDQLPFSLRVRDPAGYTTEHRFDTWAEVGFQNDNVFVWSLQIKTETSRPAFILKQPGSSRTTEFEVTRLAPVLGPSR